MANEQFKVKFGLAVGDTSATIDASTGDIVTIGDVQVGGNTIKKSGGTPVIEFSGTNLTTLAGDLEVDGNSIRSSTNTVAIEMSGADVAVQGDLTVVGNDIKSSTATAITLAGTDVEIAGDLQVTGNTIKKSGGTPVIEFSGTNLTTLAGAVQVNGNAIRSSSNVNAITMSGADVTVVGTLEIDGNAIKNSAGTNTISMSGTAVTVAGTLEIDGNAIKNSAGTDTITMNGIDVTVAGALELDGNEIRNRTGNTTITMINGSTPNVTLASDLTVGSGIIRSGNGGGTALLFTEPQTSLQIGNGSTQVLIGSVETGKTVRIQSPLILDANELRSSIIESGRIRFETGQNKWQQSRNSGSTYVDIPVSTTELAEGTNLYYTDARSRAAISVTDTGGAGSLGYNNTTGVITYTGPSSADIRSEISVTDTGGDGSLSYNNTTGVITYTGPGAADYRAALSAGTGVTYDTGTGVISIGQAVATTSNVQFADVTAGSVQVDNININGNTIISTDTNGNITLSPNGTGDIELTTANGGNVVASRNYVKGAIRNATADANGVVWYLNTSSLTAPYTGISLDNTGSTSQIATVMRNYTGNNTAASIGSRARLIFEKARNSAASPVALAVGDLMGEVAVTGYTSTGWINDQYSFVPGFFGFNATENWVSNTNLGVGFNLSLAPTGTTITSNADLVTCFQSNPQVSSMRSDGHAFMQGKTIGFVATGCSISGTTLTIGTVTSGTVAVGQLIQNAGITIATTCYIVSGSGTTWTLNFAPGNQTNQTITGRAGFISATTGSTAILNPLRLAQNTIQNSAAQTQIALSADRSGLTLIGDTVTVDTVSGNDMLLLNPANTVISSDAISLKNASQTALRGGQIDYRRTHGCFHKMANVQAAAADTVYNFDWFTDTTVHVGNQGVTVTSGNPTRINIDTAGSYLVMLEMQAANTDNADRFAWIWLAKNGTDLSETRIQVKLQKQNEQVITKVWLAEGLTAGQYLEVRFAVDNVSGISLQTVASQTSPFVAPAVPSATITITPVGA